MARADQPVRGTKLAVDLMLAGESGVRPRRRLLRYFNAAGAVGTLGKRHTPETHLIPIVLRSRPDAGTS